MKLFDLHCDTAMVAYRHGASLKHNDLHISLERAAGYEKYVQLTAMFTYQQYSDEEGWEVFHRAREFLEKECAENGIPLLRTAADLETFENSDQKTAFILTVEDVRILNGKIERVKELFDCGVRVVTPLWGGKTCIGGSHNTDEGLTEFGRAAVEEMLKVGIIPDVSHASFASTDEILDLCEAAGKAPVATHMNSYAVRAHSRNLTDDRFVRLTSLGGVAGVSLCPPHLSDKECTADDPARHFLHYESLVPGHAVFGCDYDGTDVSDDLCGVDKLPLVAEKLRNAGMVPKAVDDVCYGTAYRFMKTNLPK